jgi:hypothetical protein
MSPNKAGTSLAAILRQARRRQFGEVAGLGLALVAQLVAEAVEEQQRQRQHQQDDDVDARMRCDSRHGIDQSAEALAAQPSLKR